MERSPVVSDSAVETFEVQLPMNMVPVVERLFELRHLWAKAANESAQDALLPEMRTCTERIRVYVLQSENSIPGDKDGSFYIDHLGEGLLVCGRFRYL